MNILGVHPYNINGRTVYLTDAEAGFRQSKSPAAPTALTAFATSYCLTPSEIEYRQTSWNAVINDPELAKYFQSKNGF